MKLYFNIVDLAEGAKWFVMLIDISAVVYQRSRFESHLGKHKKLSERPSCHIAKLNV